MPLTQPRKPRYYLAVGHADNLAPRGLHSSGLSIGNGDLRLPFAAHAPHDNAKPELLAGGTIPGLPKIPHVTTATRLEEPEHPPKSTFTFSGKPRMNRLYYSGR